MREIKFRGKTNGDTGAWIIGYYHYDKSVDKHFICSLEKLIRYEVLKETVGIYVGRGDKNGKEIYNGDIIQISDVDSGIEGKIFSPFLFKVEYNDYFVSFETLNQYLLENDMSQFEIVGNEFDNPELKVR